MPRRRLETPNISLVVRDGYYYARWWRDGAWHRKSLLTKDADEALGRLAQMKETAPNPVESIASWEMHTRSTRKGVVSETKVMLRMVEMGAEVFLPWGHDHKTDMVVSNGTKLCRVQVKSARRQGSKIIVRATSVCRVNGKGRCFILQPDQCDLLVGYSPETDRCYAAKVTGRADYIMSEEHVLSSLIQVFDSGPENVPKTIVDVDTPEYADGYITH